MTKYRESKAPVTTSTYNRSEIEKGVDNIYEAISIISKRSAQINIDIRNVHLNYALTWFGIALSMIGVNLSYHFRNGRIRLKK